MAVTISGAGLRDSAVSRPPAVCPESSIRMSIRASRIARSSAASSMIAASIHWLKCPRKRASIGSAAFGGLVLKAISVTSVGRLAIQGSAK
jgi:hypothetical protein